MSQEQESPCLMNRSRSVSEREPACGERVKLWGVCQVVFGVAPVAFGVEVAEVEFVLLFGDDAGNGAGDFER
jgi:hypothetical protein